MRLEKTDVKVTFKQTGKVTDRKFSRIGALNVMPAFVDVLFDFREGADAKPALQLSGVPLLCHENLSQCLNLIVNLTQKNTR